MAREEVLEVRATAGNDLLDSILKKSFQIPYMNSQKKEEKLAFGSSTPNSLEMSRTFVIHGISPG